MFHSRLRGRTAALLTIPLAAAALAGCGSGATPGTGTAGGGEIPGITEELISGAQAEGGVVLYGGGHTREALELLQQHMQDRFGLQVTFTREDSGNIANAVSAELASGRVNADVVSLTDPATMQAWSDDGVIADAGVANLDALIDGLDDPADAQLPYSQIPLGIMYNSADTEASALPGTWAELATGDSGRIVTSDPSASGTALSFYAMLTELYPEGWLDDLAAREPIVTDSSLALPQLVLTGEADLGIPAIESAVLTAAAEGEPLAIAYPTDGVPVFASEIAMLADAPHPNAAALTVRYHLSEEFQRALAEQGSRSVLEGVPAPPGSQDISDRTLLTTSVEEVGAVREDLRGTFDQLFRR
ncbi:ABC transporter substrate-binding protein [Pseudonocardia kunmingensis]|uniref:Iron(III) transport system substrate-binding protein n=1 Tax=Pseudonocardia kunmingensis TaxID=630975 RepID=A0A543CXU7_9PSEU|nr:extracellular solute-binding protein [Pseudonocardia kunmingensis]TQM01910.1 iron(III) transport system substrate-binding protein [Pseudonocardia kunmingensis]